MPTEKQYAANQQAQQLRQAAETAARTAAGDTTAGTNPMDNLFARTGTSFVGGIPLADSGNLAEAVTNAIAEAFSGRPGTTWGESHVHVQVHEGAPIVDGIPATAVVIDARDANVPGQFGQIAPGGIVDLELEVTPPDGAADYTWTEQHRRRVTGALGCLSAGHVAFMMWIDSTAWKSPNHCPRRSTRPRSP